MSALRAASAAVLLLTQSPALAEDAPAPRPMRSRTGVAQPSEVIAADLALSRAARTRGAARSLQRAAATAALVFVPGPQPAEKWLEANAAALPAREWAPRTVWVSCDGSYAATLGAWRRGEQTGDYFALWQRQPRGEWRWLLHEDAPARPLGSEPEMIAGKVAECAGLPPRPPGFVPPPVAPLGDTSRDGSLEWAIRLSPACGLIASLRAWNGQDMAEVLTWSRPAPLAGCGPRPGERG